ncbi:MAG: hypothetical protein RBR59_01515 [Sulfurimonadaceae bacterium]|jgi:hypothetical protein|nr:hypothetical protein [Sulfurimonadaceae bacterium]
MDLKFVGPKPIISHTGITFDNNKEDKFDYLNIVVQFLKALDHSYIEDKTYTYDTSTKRFSHRELLSELKKYCPNIEEIANKRNAVIEEDIAEEIERARENPYLTEQEKEILENNINIMHNYMVQRSINKSVYYASLQALVDVLLTHHIEYIIVPMYQKFVHVFHSLQGVLKHQKRSINSNIEIYEQDGNLFTKLEIIH